MIENECKHPKVNIMMATYNGSAHIRKQLDSIMNQTYENFTLVIRDDGSTDQTVSIIKEYQNRYGEEKIVLLDSFEGNLRPPKSFYAIAKRCQEATYYSFADQDDEWDEHKLEWAVETLGKEDNSLPLCYFSSHDYYTDKGEYIRSFPLQETPIPFEKLLYQTPGSGFTMVINEALRKKMILEKDPGTEMHDRYLMRGAQCFGKLIYDEKKTARHIRHEEAVTAEDAGNKNLLIHFIKDEILSDVAKEAKAALSYFYDCFGEELPEASRQTLALFAKETGVKAYLKKLCFSKRMRTRTAGEIALRFLFLIGKI